MLGITEVNFKMTMNKSNVRRQRPEAWRAPLMLALLSLLALGGCVEEIEGPTRDLSGFKLELQDTSDANLGTADAPLPFPTHYADDAGTCASGKCKEVVVDITAVDADGSVREEFSGLVHLKVIPGEIHPADEVVQVTNGIAEDVQVRIRYTFGDARLWVEDVGLVASDIDECSDLIDNDDDGKIDQGFDEDCEGEGDRKEGPGKIPLLNQCFDGIDNDGNGLIDWPFDYGCENEDDTSEGAATYITGITDPMHFELPTIRSVQENPDITTGPSPLAGHYVEVQGRTGHDLVVTNIVGTGFYVSDLGDQNYNGLFVFNFSYPEDVEIGDRICDVGGGVVEFNALTQLQFPSWGIQGKQRSNSELLVPEDEEAELIEEGIERVDCSDRYELGEEELSKKLPLPEPVYLTRQTMNDLAAMERLEGSVVTVENVELSTYFINCDDNGSQRIESGTAESDCRNECNNNDACTELSSLYGFDQWRGRVDGAEISVSSTELVANFDVLAGCDYNPGTEETQYRETYSCPERYLRRVTGSLRQVVPTCDKFLPCDPVEESVVLFIIDPRFSTDIVE